MRAFIEKLPKAELHLHIEGSLEPELMFRIAKRNGVEIPYQSIEELREAYTFNCLQDFLDIYYQGANVLRYERDFYDLTLAYFERISTQGVLHAEIMFDPQTHTSRGISFETVIQGISKACTEAQERFGITSYLIMSYLRHLSEEEAFQILEASLPYKHLIKAVGLDSSEKGNPPSKFERVFRASVEAGYVPLAHAGEEGDASYVWEAINLLKIERIDHGNNALQDKELVEEIIRRDMAMTVCPLSNIALQVVKDIREHPLKEMLNIGLKPTVNSDDPAYFGGYINKNYYAVAEALSLTREDLYMLARNSFKYSLLDENKKAAYIKRLDEYVKV